MGNTRVRRAIGLLLIVLLIGMGLPGCGGAKETPQTGGPVKIGESQGEKPETGDSPKIQKTLFKNVKLPGKIIKWSSDALKISLEYPESYTLKVTPGDDEVLELTGPGEHDITLKVMAEPEEKDPALFIDAMKTSFDTRDAQQYQEFERKFLDLDGTPAAYLDYKWNVMKRNFRTMELYILKGEQEYLFLTVYLLKDDPAFQQISQAVFNSLRILPGEVNLAAVKAEKIQGTGVPLTEFQKPTEEAKPTETFNEPTADQKPIGAFGNTAASSGESAALATISAEFGETARMADWNELKSTFVTDFGAYFAENGIKDGEARWVTFNGEEFDGKRHYFIQRFDAGKPDSFGAHDSVGPIYLGSWYGIEMPSLVLKPAKQ